MHAQLSAIAAECPISEDADERDLIDRARTDPDAFAQLYRLHRKRIGTYLLRRTGDEHITDDLLSEVFLAAYRHLPRYRHRGVPFQYWLYRIAGNAVNRWLRRERQHRASLNHPPHARKEETSQRGDADAVDEVMQALKSLPPKHQEVISLHYLEELSVDEIAAVLRCRPGTVKSRLSRAREALRAKLPRKE